MNDEGGGEEKALVGGGGEEVIRLASPYGPIFIVSEDGLKIMRFGSRDAIDQALMDPSEPARFVTPYVELLTAIFSIVEVPERGLLMGLGGARFVSAARRLAPEMSLDIVELNPGVVEAARRHFGFELREGEALSVEDGAVNLRRLAPGIHDLAVIDAYDGETIPEGLQGAAFLRTVRRVLSSRGVAVFNLALEDPDDEVCYLDRVRRVFRSVRVYESIDLCNLVAFAAMWVLPEHGVICARAEHQARGASIDGGLVEQLRRGYRHEMSKR